MSQDNIQQDTPQEGTNQEQYASLEEAVFGGDSIEGSNSIDSAFTTGNNEAQTTAPEGQPVEEQRETTQQQPVEPSNDEKRYQYWQSQADKLKNENDQLKTQVQQVPVPVEQSQEETRVEEFPPAPEKPARPRIFNREEAYSDPSSESARYLDEIEGWRDDMNEYNTLKTQYQSAVMEEKFNNLEATRVAEAKKQEAYAKQNNQAREIREHVMGHYGMSDTEASDFMTKMSNPESLNIDNLVQLYRLKQGGAAQQQTANPTPSSDFQQVQNAQQIPSPMGVMPSGQSNTDGRSFEDKIMDTMVGDFESKNPWK